MSTNCLRILLALGSAAVTIEAQTPLPRLQVSGDKRFLVTDRGTPFFWLGDTAWDLFHRLNRGEAVEYLDVRLEQKFNVIQAVAIGEHDGPRVPNAHGDLPFTGADPSRPAVTPGSNPADAQQYDYWDHVDFIVREANRRGMYIGFLPTWGRWVPSQRNSEPIFNEENAYGYGEFLGKRYRTAGMIWILGGDRSASGSENIWRAMARGIAVGANGKEDYSNILMTYHPGGGYTSSEWFHNDPWLAFNMQQTGHGPADRIPASWTKISNDYQKTPVKPVMDGEPLYEDHPIGFRQAKEYGYSVDAHVRQRAYWNVFAGGFGHTYGHHSVWQMYEPRWKPSNLPILNWRDALRRPGAGQMQHVRALIESRPMLSRVPDQSLITNGLTGADHIAAARGDGYAFIYSAQGRPFLVNMGKISGSRVRAWWYNPRSGSAAEIGVFGNTGVQEFSCPAYGGFNTDFVLVIDDVAKNYPPPGRKAPVKP